MKRIQACTGVRCLGVRVVATLGCLVFAAAATVWAETVMVGQFVNVAEDYDYPCEAEEVIASTLALNGCELWKDEKGAPPPDVLVTGKYRGGEEGYWVEVNAYDAVVGKPLLVEVVTLPNPPVACRSEVNALANRILNPPFYEQNPVNLFREPFTGMEFVLVPGGNYHTFRTGARRKVETFLMGKFEVTQAQWEKVMGANPSGFVGPDRPVENVSWYDVEEFTRRINEKSGRNYRLPTEQEWEYAAQTRGRGHRWAGTNEPDRLFDHAWVRGNAGRKSHPVGTLEANGLGLYDMSGNVWEWCADWYDELGSRRDPLTPRGRVIRGGSWMLGPSYARTTARESAAPEGRANDNGFRLALSLENK